MDVIGVRDGGRRSIGMRSQNRNDATPLPPDPRSLVTPTYDRAVARAYDPARLGWQYGTLRASEPLA